MTSNLAVLRLFFVLIPFLLLITSLPVVLSSCRNVCNGIPINYPFGIDDGCGAPQYRAMLNCSTSLFFLTPSGSYKVESMDYEKMSILIFDPAMSTCSILQPHHDFVMSDIQNAIIPPSSDTIFALMNCSVDSPVLNHYKSLCFNFSGHSCDELYGSCTSFKLFHLLSNSTTPSTSTSTSPPPCCFTGYDTVKFMSMNILDCTHYTSVYNVDNLEGVGPLDWMYGIKLSFSVAETGCGRCQKSGGICGFDVETQGRLCICSNTVNATRECGAGSGKFTSGNNLCLSCWKRNWLLVPIFFMTLMMLGSYCFLMF